MVVIRHFTTMNRSKTRVLSPEGVILGDDNLSKALRSESAIVGTGIVCLELMRIPFWASLEYALGV
jgi:hypothetical protein